MVWLIYPTTVVAQRRITSSVDEVNNLMCRFHEVVEGMTNILHELSVRGMPFKLNTVSVPWNDIRNDLFCPPTCTVRPIKTMTFPFRLNGIHSVLFTVPFPFRVGKQPVSTWMCLTDVSASSFACQLELILQHCYGILNLVGTLLLPLFNTVALHAHIKIIQMYLQVLPRAPIICFFKQTNTLSRKKNCLDNLK